MCMRRCSVNEGVVSFFVVLRGWFFFFFFFFFLRVKIIDWLIISRMSVVLAFLYTVNTVYNELK